MTSTQVTEAVWDKHGRECDEEAGIKDETVRTELYPSDAWYF